MLCFDRAVLPLIVDHAGKAGAGRSPNNRVANALTRLKREGVVAHEGRLWRLGDISGQPAVFKPRGAAEASADRAVLPDRGY